LDEMYRMLGRERQADLDREALRWQQAAALRSRPSVAITLWRAIATHAPRPASSKPARRAYRSGEDRAAPGARFIEVSKLSDSTANQIHPWAFSRRLARPKRLASRLGRVKSREVV